MMSSETKGSKYLKETKYVIFIHRGAIKVGITDRVLLKIRSQLTKVKILTDSAAGEGQ